jgi:hypothetical protein
MADLYKESAFLMAARMRSFKAYATAEGECGNTNFWEPADQKALDAFDKTHQEALDAVSGVPMPLEWEESA